MIFNAGSKYPDHGRHLRQHHLERQRHVQPEPADDRDLRRDRDLPAARQYQGPHLQRQRLGHDRHDLRAGGPARRERQRASSTRPIVVDTLTISGNGVANTVTLNAPTGTVAYTPAQIRAAYGINANASRPLDGTGQTIAIVDAYDDPSIFQALDAFDSQFGLTASGPTLYDSVRAGVVVLDGAQPVRPGHVPARQPTRTGPAPTTGKSRKRSTSNGPMPSPPVPRSSWSRPTASRFRT